MPEPAFGIEPTGKAGGSSNSCISPRARFIWRLFLMLALVSIIYSFPKDVKTAFLTVPNPYVDVCKMYMDRFITAILFIALDFCLKWVYSLPLRLAACGILYFFYLVCNVLDCMTVSAQCIGIMSTVIVLRRTKRWGVRLLSPLVNGVLSLTTFHLKMVPGKPYEPRLLDYMAFNPLLVFFAACHAGLWLEEKWLPYQTLAIVVTVIYTLYNNMPASPPFSPLRTWLTSFVCLVFATYSAGLWAVLSFDLPPLFRHEEILVWWQKWPIMYFYVKDEMRVVINYMLCLKTLALVVGAILAFAASYPFMITEFGVPAVVSCARLVRQSMRSEEKKTMGATCIAIAPRRAMELPVEVEQMQETDIVRSLSIYPSPIGPMDQTVVTTDNVEVTLIVYTHPVVYTTATVYTTPVIYLAPVTYLAKVVYTAPVVFRASVMFGEQGRVLFMGPVMRVMAPMVEAPTENANVEAEERVREIAAPVPENNTSNIEVVMRKCKSMDLQPAFATLKMHILLMHLAESIPESATRASVDPKTAVCDEPALDDMSFMVESEVDEDAPAAVEPVTCAPAEQVISFMVEDTISVEPEIVTTEQAELSIDPPDVVVAPLDVPKAPADVHVEEQVNERIATPALNEMPSVAPVDVFPELNDAHVEAVTHVEESTYVEEPTYVEEISTVTPIVVEHSSSDDGSVSDGWITSSPTPSSRTSWADDDQPDKELATGHLDLDAHQDAAEIATVPLPSGPSKLALIEASQRQLEEILASAPRQPLKIRPKFTPGGIKALAGQLQRSVSTSPAQQLPSRRFTAAEKGKGKAQEIAEDPFVEEPLVNQHSGEHVREDYFAQDNAVANSSPGLPAVDFGDAPVDWAEDVAAFDSKSNGGDETGKEGWLAKDGTAPSDDSVDDDNDNDGDDDDNGPPPMGGRIRLLSTPPRQSTAPPAQELSRWATPSPASDGNWRSPPQPTREHRVPSSFSPNETRHDSGPSAPRRTTRYPRQARDRATRSAGMRPAEGSSAEGAADGDWKRAQQQTLRQDRSSLRQDDPESSSGPSTSSSRHAPRTPLPARRYDRDNRAGDRDIALTSRAGPSGSHGPPPRPPRQLNNQRPDRRAPRRYALADRTDDEGHSRFGGMRSDAFDEASRSGPSSSSPRHPPRHGLQNGTPNPHHGPRDDQARRQPRQDGGGPSTAPTVHGVPDRPAEYNWEAHRDHPYQSYRTQRRRR